jgi:hypothetical protein
MNSNSTDNTNTSDASMQNTNDNASGGAMMNANTGRRGRRGRGRRGRRGAMAAPAATDAAAPDAPAAPPADTSAAATPQETGGVSMGTPGTDVDLSGTYAGTVNAPDMSMSGPATLTITGSSFTLDAGGSQQAGTLTAHQWPGQIAVSMRFGTTLPATIVSLRAKKMGASGLSLMSVKGESHSFSFTTGGGGGGGRRGRRGRRGGAMMTPPADAAAPAATDASAAPPADASATPADAAPPARARRGRRGSRRRGNTNSNMSNTNNSNTPPPSN